MSDDRDRQTLIGLRATHTAHRVATDVAHPPLEASAPQRVLSIESEDASRWTGPAAAAFKENLYEGPWIRRCVGAISAIILGVFGAMTVLWYFCSR